MNRQPEKQWGASFIVTLIIVALLGIGGYVGLRYAPQAIESKAIDSILNNLESTQGSAGTSVQAVTERLTKLLQINEINDMNDSFSVKEVNGKVLVTFSYDRELDLIYKKHTMHYEKTVSLN